MKNVFKDLASRSPEADIMFRPPVNRTMRVLDRSFFKKTIPLLAARIIDNRQIANFRRELEFYNDILRIERMSSVRSVKDSEGIEGKAILLRPQIKIEGEVYSVMVFPPWLSSTTRLRI